MKRYFLLVIFLYFVQIAIADEKRFTVGVSLPLTGAVAEYGEAVRNGIEFASVENPEQVSGIQFIFYEAFFIPNSIRPTQDKFRGELF